MVCGEFFKRSLFFTMSRVSDSSPARPWHSLIFCLIQYTRSRSYANDQDLQRRENRHSCRVLAFQDWRLTPLIYTLAKATKINTISLSGYEFMEKYHTVWYFKHKHMYSFIFIRSLDKMKTLSCFWKCLTWFEDTFRGSWTLQNMHSISFWDSYCNTLILSAHNHFCINLNACLESLFYWNIQWPCLKLQDHSAWFQL